MSNVLQLRNTGGFTRMDNALMDALAAVHLSPAEFKTLHVIARLTAGFSRAEHRISAEDIAKRTHILPAHVSRAISKLLSRRIIYRVGGSRGDIGICDPREWVYEEPKKAKANQPKTVEITKIGSLDNDPKLPKSPISLLYTKKEPLVTVPSEQITAPQGGEHPHPKANGESGAGVSFDGEDFQVDDTLIAKWAKAYAPVDVEAEIVRAAVWASGNRPKKDWRRFLVNWLGRAHKRAATGADESGVPVDKIIDLYHKDCPNLPAVAVRDDKTLRALIVERWSESEQHQASGFWKTIFARANRTSQVYFRGAMVLPRLEVICSRAVFRHLEEQA